MADYTGVPCPAQPIRESVRRIFSHLIANAEPPQVQKEMIMIAYENRIITVSDAFALMHIYDLKNV